LQTRAKSNSERSSRSSRMARTRVGASSWREDRASDIACWFWLRETCGMDLWIFRTIKRVFRDSSTRGEPSLRRHRISVWLAEVLLVSVRLPFYHFWYPCAYYPLEYAGEIKDFFPTKKVTIVQGESKLLNDTYPDKWRDAILARVKRGGVDVIL